MAALDFPTSPSVNDIYSANGRTYLWDGVSWINKTVGVGSGTIILSGAGGWPSTTSGAAGPTLVETTTNKLNVYSIQFADSGSILYCEWTAIMPVDYPGGTLTAKFTWYASGTSTNSVVWGLQARSFGDLETLDQAFGTAQEVTDAHSATADQIQISGSTAAITVAGTPGPSKVVHFRAYRDSANVSDDFAATANLIAIDVSY